MVRERSKLAALEQIARIKAERELKAFAAFKARMDTLEQQVEALQGLLRQSYDSAAPLTVAEARIANAQASRNARDLRRTENEIAALHPRFEIARARAAREFGRCQVLATLRDQPHER